MANRYIHICLVILLTFCGKTRVSAQDYDSDNSDKSRIESDSNDADTEDNQNSDTLINAKYISAILNISDQTHFLENSLELLNFVSVYKLPIRSIFIVGRQSDKGESLKLLQQQVSEALYTAFISCMNFNKLPDIYHEVVMSPAWIIGDEDKEFVFEAVDMRTVKNEIFMSKNTNLFGTDEVKEDIIDDEDDSEENLDDETNEDDVELDAEEDQNTQDTEANVDLFGNSITHDVEENEPPDLIEKDKSSADLISPFSDPPPTQPPIEF